MNRCTVLQSETGDLTPLVISALRSASAIDKANAAGLGQPTLVLRSSWYEVEKSLTAAIDLTLNTDPESIHASDHRDGLNAYQAFLYRAAEFVEAVEKQVQAVTMGYKIHKPLDTLLSIQCNALKHNGMRLVWMSARDDKVRVNGYRFLKHVGHVEQLVDRFHAKRPSFSFNLEMSRLYAAMYLAGEHAGRHVIEAHGPPQPRPVNMSPVLMRMMDLPRYVFPGEANLPFPIIGDGPFGVEVQMDGPPGLALDGTHLGTTTAWIEGSDANLTDV